MSSNPNCPTMNPDCKFNNDSKGCGCGTNTYRNANVISRQLNIHLFNTPRCQAFFDFFETIKSPDCPFAQAMSQELADASTLVTR
jgi:hypothetical protein